MTGMTKTRAAAVIAVGGLFLAGAAQGAGRIGSGDSRPGGSHVQARLRAATPSRANVEARLRTSRGRASVRSGLDSREGISVKSGLDGHRGERSSLDRGVNRKASAGTSLQRRSNVGRKTHTYMPHSPYKPGGTHKTRVDVGRKDVIERLHERNLLRSSVHSRGFLKHRAKKDDRVVKHIYRRPNIIVRSPHVHRHRRHFFGDKDAIVRIWYRSPRFRFGFVYPKYHRKYVFVSIGGYWPWHYTYRRYYWYGYHPNYWYGAYPYPRPIVINNYNYYTFDDGLVTKREIDTGQLGGGYYHTDKLPDLETYADRYFEAGVQEFEEGDYREAALKFRSAMLREPEDIVLPFAYAQAQFADGDYRQAAQTLRETIMEVPEEKISVFFPRGLYPDDAILQYQVRQLEEYVEGRSWDSDAHLLLGYQLTGIGEEERAIEYLQRAAEWRGNEGAAMRLLEASEQRSSY